MDKFKEWIEDPKNTPKVAAIFGVVLLVAVFIVLKSMGIIGKGGGNTAAVMPDMSGGMPPGQAMPGGPATSPTPGPTTAPTPAPTTPTPGPAAGPATGSPAPAGPAVASNMPMLPYRKDPFLPFSGMPTKKDVMALIIPTLRRPRIAPAPVVQTQLEQQAAEALPPQPFRRMAGVLWNGRVSAILETNGNTRIVKPGEEINEGGSRVRVESITPDSISLKTLDTRTPMTITVGMAGSVTGTSATGGKPVEASGGGGPEMMPNGPY